MAVAVAGGAHVGWWWLDGELSVETVVLGDGEREGGRLCEFLKGVG